MNTHENNRHSFSTGISKRQSAMIAQLFAATTTIRHVDELFQWLADAIVQRFDVQLTQFWTNQVNRTGQRAILSRTLARQDPTVPEHIVVNGQMAKIAYHIASERRSYTPQPVESMFSSFQSALLKRYGLNYCVSYFTGRNVLLPPPSSVVSQGSPPTLFAMTTWLFLQQSPHVDLAPTIGLILEQATTLAENRGLLLPTAVNTHQSAKSLPPRQEASSLSILAELIPHRKQDTHLLLSSNPFVDPRVISDKKARWFHTAIDGHSSVAELCKVTRMNMNEIFTVLEILLAQQRIELYTSDGKLIDASLFLDNQ